MVRPQRVWLPEYYYHVTCRGNRRDALFMEDSDFRVFLYILRKIYEEHSFTIAAYCIMTNHYHMLLKTSEQPLSKIMSLINKRYASYFNIKYQLTGHVFEKRYFDKIVPDNMGILEVSKYIHLNPVQAEIVVHPEDYPWSSYTNIIGMETAKHPFLSKDAILSIFDGTKETRQDLYRDYINSPKNAKVILSNVGCIGS